MKKLIASKLLSALVLAMFTVFAVQAQTVTGVMTDADTNEPLIGANVLVKGTTIGTTSDFDGKYQIDLEPGTYTIVFSFVGYTTQEIIC